MPLGKSLTAPPLEDPPSLMASPPLAAPANRCFEPPEVALSVWFSLSALIFLIPFHNAGPHSPNFPAILPASLVVRSRALATPVSASPKPIHSRFFCLIPYFAVTRTVDFRPFPLQAPKSRLHIVIDFPATLSASLAF